MKKFVKFTTACLFLAGLASCNGSVAEPLEDVTVEQGVTEVAEESLLELPQVDGVSITPSIKNPRPGDYVTLTVTTDLTRKRLESVKFGGNTLEPISVNGATSVYGVVIPTHHVAGDGLQIVAVDVFGISVADDVKDILVLTGMKEKVAAQGDVVEFAPGAVPGYWFAGIKAVEEDVVLEEVSGKTGWYSFVMPDHAVTLSCSTGKNIYHCEFSNPKFKMNAGTAEETEITLWSITGLDSSDYYEAGKQLKFQVSAASTSYDVDTVSMDGVELIKDDFGNYNFTMPSGNPKLEVAMKPRYRSYSIGECDESYTAILKTLDENGQEIDVTDDTVVAGQAIRLYVTDSTGDPHYAPTIKFKGGSSEASQYEINVSLRYDEAGYYVFKAPYNDFNTISLVKKFRLVSTDPQVGEYSAGYHTYFGGNYWAKIDDNGVFHYTSSSVKVGETPNYTSSYDLEFPDTANLNHAKLEGSTDELYFGDDVIFRVSSSASSRGSSYLYAKNKGENVMNNTDGGTHTFSYYSVDSSNSSKLTTEFIHMETTTGDVVTAYYDFATSTVVFGATTTLISGTDGFTDCDRLLVSAPNGDPLAVYDFVYKDTYSNGYQHKATFVAIDGYQGTYVPASEEVGTENLVITGYGVATMGSASYDYHMDNGVLVLTSGDEELYFVINQETMTFAASAAPTDATEGTYTNEAGDFVSDGYGKCTLNGVEGTYVTSNGINFIVTVGEETKYIRVDSTNHTYVFTAPCIVSFDYAYTFVEDGTNGYKSNNAGIGSTDATMGITVFDNVTVTIIFQASSEANWDYFGCKINGVEQWTREETGCSGTSDSVVTKTFKVSAGDKIEFFYHKDYSGSDGQDCAWIKTLMIGSDYIIGSAE